jgi:hypothetical protein
MPLYEYECGCGERKEAVRTVANRRRAPKHCGKPMTLQVTASYSVWGVFQEYRAIGRGRPLIKTRQQHKDYLRINGYEEVGNDQSMAAPDMHATDAEWNQSKEGERREIERNFREVEAIRRQFLGN